MTFFRISTDDPYGMDDEIAVCEVPRLRKLMATLCANGFEHNVAMPRGACGPILRDMTEKYLGWAIYDHVGGDSETEVLL
jgi:hypothetical protein